MYKHFIGVGGCGTSWSPGPTLFLAPFWPMTLMGRGQSHGSKILALACATFKLIHGKNEFLSKSTGNRNLHWNKCMELEKEREVSKQLHRPAHTSIESRGLNDTRPKNPIHLYLLPLPACLGSQMSLLYLRRFSPVDITRCDI